MNRYIYIQKHIKHKWNLLLRHPRKIEPHAARFWQICRSVVTANGSGVPVFITAMRHFIIQTYKQDIIHKLTKWEAHHQYHNTKVPTGSHTYRKGCQIISRWSSSTTRHNDNQLINCVLQATQNFFPFYNSNQFLLVA